MSDYIDDDEEIEVDYMENIWDIKQSLAGNGSLGEDDLGVLLDYIARLESTISELASKTGFADDYCGGWQGYIETEYE